MRIYLTLVTAYICIMQVRGGQKHKNSLPECGQCVKEKCPHLGAVKVEDCPRDKIIYDDCGCCSRCSLRIPITGRPIGKGNPCEQFNCPRRQVCTLNMQKLPICVCPPEEACDHNMEQRMSRMSSRMAASLKKKSRVCASDGRTYPSKCHMKVASCRLKRKLRVERKGSCKKLRREEYDLLMGNYKKFRATFKKDRKEFRNNKVKLGKSVRHL